MACHAGSCVHSTVFSRKKWVLYQDCESPCEVHAPARMHTPLHGSFWRRTCPHLLRCIGSDSCVRFSAHYGLQSEVWKALSCGNVESRVRRWGLWCLLLCWVGPEGNRLRMDLWNHILKTFFKSNFHFAFIDLSCVDVPSDSGGYLLRVRDVTAAPYSLMRRWHPFRFLPCGSSPEKPREELHGDCHFR